MIANVEWRDELELTPMQLQARLRWARAGGHPHYWWPEVAPQYWRTALSEIEQLSRAALRGERACLAITAVAPLRAFRVAAFTSGMGPLLGCWCESGVLQASDEVREVLALHLKHARTRAQRLSLELKHVVHLLRDVAPQPLIIKAAHTAAAYFPEAAARPAADIDIVVRPEEFARAESVLRDSRYVMSSRQHQPRKSEWLVPGSTQWPRSLEIAHARNPYGVDLHASLDRNFFGVRTLRFDAGHAMTVAAPTVPAASVLRQPLLLALLAAHASEGLHNLTLLRLTELVLVARRDTANGTLQWDEFRALLRALRAQRFVYPALELAERFVPGSIEPRVLADIRAAATPRMRRVIGQLTPSSAQRLDALSLDERFMWCAGAADHARRLLHMALPAPVGWSPRRLVRQYRERLHRIGAARVTWRIDAASEERNS